MPPRRSTARAASATPIRNASPASRSVRGETSVAPDSTKRRAPRGGSQQPSHVEADINNPRLPEVQIQQSYAYGSSKTAVLPTQLVARKRMNLKDIADTIDAGVEQAKENLQKHLEEAQAHLQTDARSERAQRRASRERSREGSVASDGVDARETQRVRVAAWADSLDSSRLEEIPEEDGNSRQSTPDQASHKDTDPSSFPSGIFDHSYNYERGLRRPNITIRDRPQPFPQRFMAKFTSGVRSISQSSKVMTQRVCDWLQELASACGQAIRDLPKSPIISMLLTLIVGIMLACLVGFLFCYTYTAHLCDPFTASSIGRSLQGYCGTCVRTPQPKTNISADGGADLNWLNNALLNMDSRMRSLEAQINTRITTERDGLAKELETLKRQYMDLSAQTSKKGNGRATSAHNTPSPVIGRVNYFAANNGAQVILPLTSPTLQKRSSLLKRMALRLFGSTVYMTQPPESALKSWHDVGDCWCASATPREQDSMRLGVRVAGLIYPKELVIENQPSGGSLSPGTTPKSVELWADFGHLDSTEWEKLNIRQMQGNSPLTSNYALIGRGEYDASEEASHVQALDLSVNQDENRYHAQTFILRVISNYGANHTCLYRVRLHGAAVEENI
ncbi:hypothetical protein B0A52_08646 [Exophiala mesophila]|uniref:SUN domain-containing protein n=1 Tax=Exophiala mesophila TaxID=212818 RepID=A0A438MWB6_EXOME|nr:hypothetical protein B0A52_08646 [Exophiala mesophila]